MKIQKETLVVLLAPMVIAGCLLTLFWPEGEDKSVTKPHEALGYILADNLVENLGKGARIVIFTAAGEPNAPVTIQSESFTDRCRKVGVDIVYQRPLARFEQGRDDPQKELPVEVYLAAVAAYSDVDAFVSFVGYPRLTLRELRALPESFPPMVAVSRSANEIRGMLLAGVLEYAVLPRFAFPAPETIKGDSRQSWFDRYFQVVDTVEDLPLGPRKMPQSPHRSHATTSIARIKAT